RGLAMGMLFIPVSTMSLSTLKGQQIGQGAAFTGMMRQLGGSFGIALITTFMTIGNATHRYDLIKNIAPDNAVYVQQYNGAVNKFMAAGMPPNAASAAAYWRMEGSVMRQASVLTYMDVFLYIGIMFLVCVPFILMIRTSKQKVSMSEAMH
ncbi:MAG TPA: MFS transporter, partial [Chitinophagaceae bacterium]|nr:MFS transporter [Chitinophagaceae bacterium]